MLQIIFNVAVVVFLAYLTKEMHDTRALMDGGIKGPHGPGPTVVERINESMRAHLARYHRGGSQ